MAIHTGVWSAWYSLPFMTLEEIVNEESFAWSSSEAKPVATGRNKRD